MQQHFITANFRLVTDSTLNQLTLLAQNLSSYQSELVMSLNFNMNSLLYLHIVANNNNNNIAIKCYNNNDNNEN